MRVTGLALFGALSLAAFGCGGGDGNSSGNGAVAQVPTQSNSSGQTENAYQNGHPIALSTTDEYTLFQESEIVRIVNDHRISLGKNALVSTTGLADVARAHSMHMVIHNFFAHQNPEGDSPGTRILKSGILWSMAGENLAAGYPTPKSAFVAWMNSPGHKENVERTDWVFTGVGYWKDATSNYDTYWTQNFSRP